MITSCADSRRCRLAGVDVLQAEAAVRLAEQFAVLPADVVNRVVAECFSVLHLDVERVEAAQDAERRAQAWLEALRPPGP